jgi:hypothetical protein
MGWPKLRREPKQPTFKEQVNEDRKTQFVVDENRQDIGMGPEGVATGSITFDFQVIDDEKMLGLITPYSPLYCHLVMPLLPFFSRLNYLSNCSERDARHFRLKVDVQIARLKNRARSTEEYLLLDGLRTYFHNRINDSVKGFKIRVLAEKKRTLTIEEAQLEKKRRWSIF